MLYPTRGCISLNITHNIWRICNKKSRNIPLSKPMYTKKYSFSYTVRNQSIL